MTDPARALPVRDDGRFDGRPLPVRPAGPHLLPDRPAGPGPSRTATAPTQGRARPGVSPPLAVARTGAPTRRPVHVLVAVGMTAGLYAFSLAGVSALQSAANAQLTADSAPAVDAVAGLKRAHDAEEHSLDTLAGAYATAADRYKSISSGIAGHEDALAALGAQVKAAAGSARALSVPTLTRLPAIPLSAVSTASRPVVNACTTASGKPC